MRFIARALLALTALLPIACTAASDEPYKEGTHYKLVREVSAPADSKRIRVEEFFWYGCGHCYAFEPEVEKWAARKAADVDFVQIPNSLGRPVGLTHSKVFYTAEALNLMDKIHRPFFDAIHQEHQNLDTEAEVQAFFNQKTGLLPDVFNSTFNGFAVDSRVRRAEALARQYGVASTPSLVVDGRYIVNASMTGGFPEMIKVLDFLVDKARKERKKK